MDIIQTLMKYNFLRLQCNYEKQYFKYTIIKFCVCLLHRRWKDVTATMMDTGKHQYKNQFFV